jgi:hypothetical protein
MKPLIAFILLQFCTFGFAQIESNTPALFENIAIKADTFIGYDKFDYAYFVKNNVIYKVRNGESFEYKNLALGQITKVDLLNPLKVIVFYERFNTVVTLDSQMNETLKIDFSQIKSPLVVSKIGIASQNQLWVFDQNSQQIYLYDTINGTLKSIGTPISEQLIFYNSDFNYFEWIDHKNKWYQCSVFGSVQELKYRFEFERILFSNNEFIFYKQNEKVLVFNRKTYKINVLENIDKTFESLTFKNQILSIFTTQGISNYKITIP